MNKGKRAEIFARLRTANPAPTTELEYASTFQLLVAVILSAQATDKSVNLATKTLFADAPTPHAMLALGVAGLTAYINRIGLHQGKAKNVIATCRELIEKHGGEVPREREALEALPGVGRKTANVVLNTAFGEATIAVDTHIFRVANRTRLATGKTVIVASTRGGIYSTSEGGQAMEHQESYLKVVFGFFGITDMRIVRAEGVAMGDAAKAAALNAAQADIAIATSRKAANQDVATIAA